MAEIPEKYIKRSKELIEGFEIQDPFIDHVLKSQSMVESTLDLIIKTFVFNDNFIDESNLNFNQKVKIAQSMSLQESNNTIWEVVSHLNKIRNDVAHNRIIKSKDDRMKQLDDLMKKESLDIFKNFNEHQSEIKIIIATTYIDGFLNAFKEEVERFRSCVDALDYVVNTHRHNSKRIGPRSVLKTLLSR